MSKRYTVFSDGKHRVIDADSHKIEGGGREGFGDKTLKLMKDGEEVFSVYGYFTFTSESENLVSYYDDMR